MKGNRKKFRVIKKKMETQKSRRRIGMVLIAVAILVLSGLIGCYIYSRQTYDRTEISASYKSVASNHGSYVNYAEGVLRYSRDGVAYFDSEGQERWNRPCQIQTPMIEMCEDTAVMGDKDGTSVIVLQQEGVKGEFQTARPIEQLSVSKQGIVAAVLKDEVTPRLVCYDAKGNILVEQKASLLNTGYPMDIALSPDGRTLLVSYLCIAETSVFTEVVYYNFGAERTDSINHEVARTTYEGQMIPTVAFLDEVTSVLMSDEQLLIWEGTSMPSEKHAVTIGGQIQQIAYNDQYIAVVAEMDGSEKAQLLIYNKKGQRKVIQELDETYAKIIMSGREVLLYEESRCMIVNTFGVIRFKGEFDVNIHSIAKIGGLSRYLVADNNGLYKIQLKK